MRDYQDSNKDYWRKASAKRQSKNHRISKQEWIACKNYFNNSCAYCGLSADEHWNQRKGEWQIFDLHKEHVDDQGANDLSNCIPSCGSCNSEKHVYSLDHWYSVDNPKYDRDKLLRIHKWLETDYKQYFQGTSDFI